MASEAQKRATAKYDRENKVTITVKLNKKTEADLVAFMEGIDNKQGYIKSLIREAMKGEE